MSVHPQGVSHTMIGQLLDGRYQVVQALGVGGFGQTYIAKDTRRPGNPTCVVKHLKPASSDPNFLETARRLFTTEAETLERLGYHDQIPRLLAYFEQDREFYLVQEFIEGHPLSTELLPGQRWEESRVIQMLQEVLGILEFVHSQGVIHRDIKPENIIRRQRDNKLVLLDFGAVKQVRSQMAMPQAQVSATIAVGTPGYMPSEQGRGQPRPSSDIYSLGIIGIQALTGLMPQQLPEDTQTGEILWQQLVSVSPGLAAVLNRMVRYHFMYRYQTATDALQALQEITNPPSPAPPVAPTRYPQPEYPPAPATPPLSRQQTIPAVPSYRSQQPYVAPANSSRSVSGSPNLLPILIGVGFAAICGVGGSLAYRAYQAKSPLTNSCFAAVIGGSNIRSEPYKDPDAPDNNVIKTISEETKLAVTGKKTRGGWIEVKLPQQSSGWVYSTLISNEQEMNSCLKARKIDIQVVADDTLIPKRPVANATPKPEDSPKPPPKKVDKPTPDKPTTKDEGASILAKATEKLQSGDIEGAIALALSIPPNSSAFRDAQNTINQWRKNWSAAEAAFNDAEKAFNEGRWQDVLAYAQNPNYPNIRYWKERLQKLVVEAQERQKAEKPSPSPSDSPKPSPSPSDSPSPSPSPSPSNSPSPIIIPVPSPTVDPSTPSK